MPIDPRELKRNLILVDERTTVRQVHDRIAASGDPWTFVVVRLSTGRFAVLRWTELVTALDQHAESLSPLLDVLSTTLGDLPGLLAPRATDPILRAAMSTDQARRRVAQSPERRLVVLDGETVAGVLAVESRSAWRPPGAAADDIPERRWINFTIEGSDAAEPMYVGHIYTLAFDVDSLARLGSVATSPFEFEFTPDEPFVVFSVQLASDDFKVHSGAQALKVPRRGRSMGKVRFDVEPTHDGESVIRATFTKDGNLIQVLTVRLQIGAPVPTRVPEIESLGRPVGAAFVVQPRDVALTILNTGTGYQVIMCSAVGAVATLPITPQQLDQMVSEVRQELQAVVRIETGPRSTLIYQTGIDIPPDVNRQVLQRLARAGMRLFQRVFYGPAADLQANRLGDALRTLAQRERLKIQIFAQQFPLPWSMLYVAEEFDPERIDPELFLGFKHSIEHIPLQPNMGFPQRAITSQPYLTVSLNVNTDIDDKLHSPVVADQVSYWEQVQRHKRATTIVRKSGAEVTRALTDPTTPDQILYFYCHAVSRSLSEAGGPDQSCLMLSGNQRLSLEDLNLLAPPQKRLPGAPLVFINACESAELSPLFYDGFVPYFMQKGARGVIGTECETPARFAAAWARRFFERFLNGVPLGQSLLDLRREFLYNHNNVLGLLYALYCDGDTIIEPAL
jgi:hypothetical protein